MLPDSTQTGWPGANSLRLALRETFRRPPRLAQDDHALAASAVDHVAVALSDRCVLARHWRELSDAGLQVVEPVHLWPDDVPGCPSVPDADKKWMTTLDCGPFLLVLLAPHNADDLIALFLNGRLEPQVHHIAFAVPDTLRNATCVTTALAAGASDIVLYGKGREGLDHIQRDAARYQGPKWFAGEVEGRPIPGFDSGNSPLEFTSAKVEGKRIFYASTNNGGALQQLLEAEESASVFWACMLNGAAVGRAISEELIELPLLFLCSGFRGTLCLEDLLCAGQVLLAASDRLAARNALLDDSSLAAVQLASRYFDGDGHLSQRDRLCAEMKTWRCGSVLTLLGQASDVEATVTGEGLSPELLAAVRTCIPRLDAASAPPRIIRWQ